MLKHPFSGTTIIITAVLMFLISAPLIYSQKKALPELKLQAVQEGNTQIPEDQWQSLKFTKGNPVYITFALSDSKVKSIYYRVMLDTEIIEPNLIENLVTLKSLSAGVHLLKITAVIDGGNESEPLTLTLDVKEPPKAQPVQEEPKKTEAKQNPFSNPLFFYCAAGLCIFQLIIIVLLLLRGKPQKTVDTSAIEAELKQSKEEYIEVYNSHKRLKEELKDLKEYNDYLKKQKSDLEATIKNLETVNVNLIEQKEKLVESKRQLELLHTQKDELYAMAIHDIKNPLSAMRGYIELLNSYDLNAAEQHEIMASLVSSSENVVKLTQSMCTIIAKERPEPTLKFSPTSMKKIIDEICNQNISYAKAKSIKLFNKSSVGLPDITMDEVKIQEVIENLVNNAIKYGPPETTVEVRTFIKGNFLTVEVQDTGVGIPEADLKKAFQKGAVLTPKPTGVEQSSGLGLWIVKRIIEEHNGKVWVNSKIGSGSTFGFELPMEARDRKTTMY